MPIKKGNSKKGEFSLTPITLSEPVRATDGFTNLVENPAEKQNEMKQQESSRPQNEKTAESKQHFPAEQNVQADAVNNYSARNDSEREENERAQEDETAVQKTRLTESELLRILDADNLDEIYELTDVLRASSLKLYAALIQLADPRGRARVKNHELMSKAGIKGIATLYKQERWLMDLKLLEKKAKPGPHDGSSYVVHKLESLPLPDEIYEKFNEFLSNLK